MGEKQTFSKFSQQKPQLQGRDLCLKNEVQPDTLNRRRFLELAGLGVGGVGLLSFLNSSFANEISTTLLENQSTTDESGNQVAVNNCQSPSISTRLFSSSNASIDKDRVALGLQRLACAGFDIKNANIAYRQYLRFGGTDLQRASDLQNIATGAIEAPKMLMAMRGGYGAMRILKLIDWRSLGQVLRDNQSILVGFSDVTAIQCALLAKGGMSSLAGPMLYSEFGKQQPDVISCQGFVNAITNPNLKLKLSSPQATADPLPITGIIWGGNLSVISALAGSEYMPKPDGGIVFLEDVGEQPYQVERMLYSLYLSGAFKNQQAIVLGSFTGTGEDSYDGRYDMSIVRAQLSKVTGLPVYSELHFGHVARKQSFPIGVTCKLNSQGNEVMLEFNDYPTVDKELIHPEGLYL